MYPCMSYDVCCASHTDPIILIYGVNLSQSTATGGLHFRVDPGGTILPLQPLSAAGAPYWRVCSGLSLNYKIMKCGQSLILSIPACQFGLIEKRSSSNFPYMRTRQITSFQYRYKFYLPTSQSQFAGWRTRYSHPWSSDRLLGSKRTQVR